MHITKYEHSCVVIEEQNRLLVIDPGKFSVSFKATDNIDAVVITHVHSDHFDRQIIASVLQLNPDAVICSVQAVADELTDTKVQVVGAGMSCGGGPFHLSFYGGNHELYEGFDNVGVSVNDTFYYPGDSYAVPDKPVKILGAPASAPWLRVPDAGRFLADCKAEKAFPMHNAVLSEIGESIHYRILGEAAKEAGTEWLVLRPSESLET